jgi:hypothetical protein
MKEQKWHLTFRGYFKTASTERKLEIWVDSSAPGTLRKVLCEIASLRLNDMLMCWETYIDNPSFSLFRD